MLNLGEHYTISDGCGCMSMAAARKVAEEMELDPMNPPSCIQVFFKCDFSSIQF